MRNAFFGETGMIVSVPERRREPDAATVRTAAVSATPERRGRDPRVTAREPQGSRGGGEASHA